MNHLWKTVLWRILARMTAPNGKLRLASVMAISAPVTRVVDLLNGREHGYDVWAFGEQVCILQREQACYFIVSKLDQEDFILSVSL